jgi:2-iminobutanoate/2-iminopropanoate deaminase
MEQQRELPGTPRPAVVGQDQPPSRRYREKLNPPTVHTPQASYSHVARVGNTLYIAGQTATDLEGNLVGRGDAEAQAEQCLRNIGAILEHFGGGPENVMKITTFITNWGFRPMVAAARDRFFSAPYPASTLVVCSALASPDYLVEIEAIAVLDE